MTPPQIQDLPVSISALAVCISLLALIVAIKGYRRKTGTLIRGSFATTSSRACNDRYVSEVILENAKDRATTIFCIYLKLGLNHYIELEDLEDTPLILKPFETYHKRFGPIEFYGVSDRRINLNNLLDDTRTKKQLILSTSAGRYKVQARIHRWSPIETFFRNYLTGLVKPVRSTYKGKELGANIAYVVELTGKDGNQEIVPLQLDDYEVQTFRNFRLTEASLRSKENLETFLKKQMDDGNMSSISYTVHDMRAWRIGAHEFYSNKVIEASRLTAFQYHFWGRLRTKYLNGKLDRENKARTRASRAADRTS